MRLNREEHRRFWARVKESAGGCWEWLGYRLDGHGRVRPSHLEPVTSGENTRRGFKARAR